MSAERETVDVAPLADTYQVIGELRGGRLYFARRRDDRSEVIVRVARSSEAGGNNALAHLASDVQLLRTLTHPGMPRVFDGRWLGTDAFAVVSERIYGDTVQEILDREERFANPRIASLLEDVCAVIGWARAHGVVHRGVTPDMIIIERDTNRLFVSLGATPIPITGVPGETADARTIGRLAWTLLSGSAPDPKASLVDLCPNLAMRVVDATERLVRLRDEDPAPDVGAFIGIIAAGDVLKQAEVEITAAKDEYIDFREQEIKKYEAQRVELERKVADSLAALDGDRRTFEKFASDERASIEADRAQMEIAMRERQEKLATVRAELERQRQTVERRLASLETQRAELVRLRDEAVALGASARLRSRMSEGTPVGLVSPDSERDNADDWAATNGDHASESRFAMMQWLGPVASVVVLVLLIALGLGMSRRSHRGGPVTVGGTRVIPTAPSIDTVRPPRGGFLTQSPGGEVTKAPTKSGVPIADSTALARRDSIRPDTATRRDTTKRRVRAVSPDTVMHSDSVTDLDTGSRPRRITRPDTIARARPIARPDTTPRIETSERTDSVRPETIPFVTKRPVRPDTLIPPEIGSKRH
ncbi:MAG: hypothetical protein ACM3SX_09540 [Deltaproteobacteria bacterium]